MTSRIRSRIIALLSIMGITLLIAIPLLSTAQDATPEMTEEEMIQRGASIYYTVCVACHQVDGNGVPGIYLPLNQGGLINLEDPTLFIYTVLYGRGGMPRFNGAYTDAEIASVITFVRQEWDNDSSPVSEAEVAAVRENYGATPIVSPTPEGQIPEGQANTEGQDDPSESTPVSTPAS